jgi:hypothetical protein
METVKLRKIGWFELGKAEARREFRERHGEHIDDVTSAMCAAAHVNHKQLEQETTELRREALSASIAFAQSSLENSGVFVAFACGMVVSMATTGWWNLLVVPFIVAYGVFAVRGRRQWNTARGHMEAICNYEVPPKRFVWFTDDEDVMDVFVGEEE